METIRTLIVDDEPRIRRGIERLVQSCGEGWEIAGVLSDGREALEFLHETGGAVDLVISDVKMPEMDGLTFVKEARKHYSFFPLFISGYDDFEYLRTALREGAVDYLLKPVDREQFHQRMAEIRDKIVSDRSRSRKFGELEQQAEKLQRTRQTQTLSYTTSPGVDLSRLGYWAQDFPKGHYRLMYVSLDALPVKSRSYTVKDWEAYFYALENILEELIDSHHAGTGGQGWCWRGGQSDFWALLLPEEGGDAEASVRELADRIRSAIRMYTPFSASVACSDAIEDLYLLPSAKRQCLSLIQYRLVSGGNRLFMPEDAGRSRQSEEQAEEEMPASAERLRQAVEQGRLSDALQCSRQFFEELKKKESPASIQRAVQNLLILIHSAALASCGHSGFSVPLEDALGKLQKAAHLQELRQEIDGLIEEAVREIERTRRSSNSSTPVEQAKAWIREHLAGDLTIKRIADHVHMNPTYFCECFKMQTGETVLDYVTRQRMERAKELLREPGLKLQEVCERIGYADVKYFSRLFKGWTGLTPSQYREQAAPARPGAGAD